MSLLEVKNVSLSKQGALSFSLGWVLMVLSGLAIAMCRAHRYPPTTKEMAAKTRGIGAHTDFGALTLLLQDDGNIYI
jgi:hypothetical protein